MGESMVETKKCPNCGEDKTREDMGVCELRCDEIVCNECQRDHLVSYHDDPRNLEDEEWDDIE